MYGNKIPQSDSNVSLPTIPGCDSDASLAELAQLHLRNQPAPATGDDRRPSRQVSEGRNGEMTLVQEDAFADALKAVAVLDIARDDDSPQRTADDLVLASVEREQMADDESASLYSSSEGLVASSVGEDHLAKQAAMNGAPLPDANSAAAQPGQPPAAGTVAAAGATAIQDTRLSSGDGPPPHAQQSPLPLARGMTRGVQLSGQSGPTFSTRLRGCAQTAGELAVLLLSFLVREAGYGVILVPNAIAFLAHRDEPLRPHWDVWLLRPAYALLLGRIAASVVFALIGNTWVLEILSARVTLFIEAFRGWQSIVICYLLVTAGFFFGPAIVQGEREAWDSIQDVDFLVGVYSWLAAVAITRGLLDALSQVLFLNLKDGHFEERVQAALLSMRLIRILFATGRAASNREKKRRTLRQHEQRARHGGRNSTSSATQPQLGSNNSLAGLPSEPSAPNLPSSAHAYNGSTGSAGAPAHGAQIPRGGSYGRDLPTLGSKDSVSAASPPRTSRSLITGALSGVTGAIRYGPRERDKPKPIVEAPALVPELFIYEDSVFSMSSSISSLSDQLELLKSAVSSKNSHFVSSIAEARKRGIKFFAHLYAEYSRELAQSRETGAAPPVDGDGPPETVPRARLLRWCSMATRKRGAAFQKKVAARIEALFAGENVGREEFVSVVENVYREQRFVSAAVKSFDSLNGHVHNFLVGFWGLLMFVAGVFLVEWGVSFEDWVVPISSTFLSFAVLLGWLPYETFAGILFVLAARPYDIGDRIIVNDPGTPGAGREPFTVADIGLLSTRVMTLNGQEHILQNFVTRKLSVINVQRSRNPVIPMVIQMPSRTPGNQISELIEVVRAYVAATPTDWVTLASSFISSPDYKNGVIEVNLFPLSAHKLNRDELLDAARTRLYLFVHVYMQSAGMEYVQPRQDVHASFVGPGGIPQTWPAVAAPTTAS